MAFTHLHVHTEFSLLDGSNKIKDYVARVKELGMTSASITDHGVMYGAIDFYKEAKKNGINPIIGCEVYVAPHSRLDRENLPGEDRYYHLVLLAENNEGYANLMKIVSAGFVEGYYYKPRVDKEILRKYHKGIIALSACLAGEIPRAIVRNQIQEAKRVALDYQEIFGKGNFFLELQDHGISDQQIVNQNLIMIAKELDIELVATNDVHYTMAEDAEPHDVLLCMQTGKKLADEDRMRYVGGQYYVKSEVEMKELFPYAIDAVENTDKIAKRCHVTIEFGVTKLPKFDVPDGLTTAQYLEQLCMQGLKKRYPENWEDVEPQLRYELGIIEKMGYVEYFLITWDFINYAKSQDIMVGPGRGSAAGSVVSYCLYITDIDPRRYNLIFERFLNPERVSMPDIDVDFSPERRQEVIDYVKRKYGERQVAQIVTFGTLAARNAIRSVGRVMDLPYDFCDKISKSIPKEIGITIDKALATNSELSKLYEEDESAKKLIDMSKKLEGLPSNTSMHAAGVVICQLPVDEYVPLSRGSDDSITTQYVMTTLEELGLLKMDFLGLRNLTIIQNAVQSVKDNRGIEVDLNKIDYEDQDVLGMLGQGKTEGVFQLESAGMTNFMKQLKPQCLEDLIAGISLYRPGPMDFIPAYIRGKNDPENITYECPELEPILSPTYGCIVYQEQVMEIVRNLAGYTLGRSDMVRRAMSKKKGKVMEQERKNFVYGNEEEGVLGCVANGIKEEVANHIYDEMIDFAKYAFNKSHAAGYAVVAYQTAYLKYYYSAEYMAATMGTVMSDSSKVSNYIYACRQMGLKVLPPNINEGEGKFSVTGDDIRYGLSAIKSVGGPVIEAIVEERLERGKYKSLDDFLERMVSRVNKRAIENLIKAGAFDGLGANRKQCLLVYPLILEHLTKDKKNTIVGQVSLFDIAPPEVKAQYEITYPEVEEFDKETLLSAEKEVLGVYISGHPLDEFEERWRKNTTAISTDFTWDDENEDCRVIDGERHTVGGMIVAKTIKYTKNNKVMAFLTLEDLVGTVEIIVFPRDYEKYQALLVDDGKIFVTGRVNAEDDKNAKLICEEVFDFDDIKTEVWLQFETLDTYQSREHELLELMAASDGNDDVVIYLKKEKGTKRLPKSKTIALDEQMKNTLYKFLGESNVKVVEKSLVKSRRKR